MLAAAGGGALAFPRVKQGYRLQEIGVGHARNDADFLADDTALIAQGKPFRRIDEPVPADGKVELCVRAPSTGPYAVAVLHDRNGDLKFNAFVDGAGFPNNPKLGLAKPKARQTSLVIGPGVTAITVIMNYWNGLSFGPHHFR